MGAIYGGGCLLDCVNTDCTATCMCRYRFVIARTSCTIACVPKLCATASAPLAATQQEVRPGARPPPVRPRVQVDPVWGRVGALGSTPAADSQPPGARSKERSGNGAGRGKRNSPGGSHGVDGASPMQRAAGPSKPVTVGAAQDTPKPPRAWTPVQQVGGAASSQKQSPLSRASGPICSSVVPTIGRVAKTAAASSGMVAGGSWAKIVAASGEDSAEPQAALALPPGCSAEGLPGVLVLALLQSTPALAESLLTASGGWQRAALMAAAAEVPDELTQAVLSGDNDSVVAMLEAFAPAQTQLLLRQGQGSTAAPAIQENNASSPSAAPWAASRSAVGATANQERREVDGDPIGLARLQLRGPSAAAGSTAGVATPQASHTLNRATTMQAPHLQPQQPQGMATGMPTSLAPPAPLAAHVPVSAPQVQGGAPPGWNQQAMPPQQLQLLSATHTPATHTPASLGPPPPFVGTGPGMCLPLQGHGAPAPGFAMCQPTWHAHALGVLAAPGVPPMMAHMAYVPGPCPPPPPIACAPPHMAAMPTGPSRVCAPPPGFAVAAPASARGPPPGFPPRRSADGGGTTGGGPLAGDISKVTGIVGILARHK